MIEPQPKQETLLARILPVLLIGTAWVWMFWPMMTGRTVVGFRDSAYLYYPLFKWIDAQWAAGEIPLWNPYCNFGMPVVGDGSSSVFYPGKLIFFCRFLTYPARYGIYLAVHIPIAALGTYWFAKTLRANRAGATLAAFSFAFGGSVLFQVTNVIFLVSAAWLPFALCCVWKMVKTRKVKWPVAAGVCCALMILGGDPQMVYHVGLISIATIVGEFLRRKRRRLKSKTGMDSNLGNRRPYRWLISATLRLGLMVVVTSMLAAIQLLPTVTWSQHSERMKPSQPANIYQAYNAIQEDTKNDHDDAGILTYLNGSLIGPPTGTIEHSYQFSQPPWSITELFWPNISGKPFPRHQRSTNSLAGAERVWVPSLYCGVLVALLALIGLRLWGRQRKQVWLTYLFLFFATASFGWYGVVWLINEVVPNVQQISDVGPQVGGVYWLMNMVLPKYFAFRYPAKLFVIAALAISLLAGVNLRTTRLSHSLVGRRILAIYLAVSTTGILALASHFRHELFNLSPDWWFGQFDAVGAEFGLYVSMVQPMLVMLVAVGVFVIAADNQRWRKLAPLLLVTISILDTATANHWLLCQIPANVLESETQVSSQIDELKNDRVEPLRIYRTRDYGLEPAHWPHTSQDNRLSELVKWQRESLYPQFHLGEDVALIGSFSSVWPVEYEKLVGGLDWLERFPTYAAGTLSKIRYDNVAVDIPYAKVNSDFEGRLGVIKFSENGARALGLVERSFVLSRADEQTKMGTCKVKEFSINRVVINNSSELPCTMHYFVFSDEGWTATVKDLSSGESDPAALRPREDKFGFELDMDPGDYEVEFKYNPIEFWIGAWFSGASWVLLISVLVFRLKTVQRTSMMRP